MYPLPFPFALQGEQGIGHRLVVLRLPAQFAVALPALGREHTLGQRALDGASWLAGVGAIAVAALGSQAGDLIEGAVDRVLAGSKLEFAHARSVDQGSSLRERDEFSVRGGMASSAVGLVHLRGAQPVLAHQAVHQRGFADAR